MLLARIVVWLALLAPAAAEAGHWAGLAASGGWASNVNLGVADAPALTAASRSAHVHLGGDARLARGTALSLELSWDWEDYPALPELELHQAAGTAALGLELGAAAHLRLSTTGGLRLAEDAARRGHDLAAGASLRLGPWGRLAVRLAGRASERTTSDPAFGGRSLAARVGLDAQIAAPLLLGAEATAEAGDATVSTTVATWERRGGAGRGPGRPTLVEGAVLVYQPARVVILGAGLDGTLELPAGFSLLLRARREWLEGEGLDGAASLLTASLRWSGSRRDGRGY